MLVQLLIYLQIANPVPQFIWDKGFPIGLLSLACFLLYKNYQAKDKQVTDLLPQVLQSIASLTAALKSLEDKIK